MRICAVLCCFAVCGVLTAVAAEPIVHMLVPGFTVQELPVRLSNINNLRFAPDGRLTALGYDGRIHLLSDTDSDGLEDKDELFWEKPTLSVPVGMVWSPEGLYVSSHGKVSLFRDTDGDGKADVEEVIASGWPPTDVGSGGVDATAVTRDQQGNLYFGLLVADYSNAYRIKDGVSHYDTNSLRGTIQKWNKATRGLETIATGIRVPYTLAFNRLGDLFLTDQEGETWMPNGNPLDELNHIIPGRNYGFPPRHEKWLPDLISEPPVVAFGPQHESTCGFVFNESSVKQKCFGPEWWEGDAFVAGESRGKIWRVRLGKTSNGYVGKEFLIARLSMLTTDVAISPKGDLYVSCHSGPPDWGTGPQGEGKLFKISYTDPKAPQPIIAWQRFTQEVRVAFDRPLDGSITNRVGEMLLEGGEFVSAADRFEVLKPPYEVVKKQEAASRRTIRVHLARMLEEGRVLYLQTDESLREAMTYALTLPGVRAAGSKSAPHTVDVQFDVSGGWLELVADHGLKTIPFLGDKAKELARSLGLKSDDSKEVYDGWLPTPDLAVSKEIVRPYDGFENPYRLASKRAGGDLGIRFNMPAKAATIHATANGPFTLFCLNAADGINYYNLAAKQSNGTYAARMYLGVYKPTGDSGHFYEVQIRSDPQAALVNLAYSTPEDPTPRPLPLRQTFLPGAHLVNASEPDLPRTDLAGGDYERGRDLFFGEQLKCSTCHKIRGEGKEIGPDLTNLIHKDAGSVLRDIRDPNATLNPDYVGYNIELSNGESLSGFVRAHEEKSIRILGVDGKETMVDRFNIKELRASSVSLMPSNLLDTIKESQIRDLLTFLLNESPKRTQAELEAILRVSNSEVRAASSNAARLLNIVLVASKQDHGPGQHDYPAWQKKWNEMLASSPSVTVTNAWLWPTAEQFERADLFLFYYWNHDWNAERYRQLDDYLRRGGGIVVLHSATIADKEPEQLAARIGLAAQPSRTKYLHAPLDIRITATNHPITKGLPDKIHFLDEPYWPMIGDTNKVVVLATTEQEGEVCPMLWTFEKDKGRVFASILGHYTWSLDDPLFRLLILRGLAWAVGEPAGRFERSATADVSLIETSASSGKAEGTKR